MIVFFKTIIRKTVFKHTSCSNLSKMLTVLILMWNTEFTQFTVLYQNLLLRSQLICWSREKVFIYQSFCSTLKFSKNLYHFVAENDCCIPTVVVTVVLYFHNFTWAWKYWMWSSSVCLHDHVIRKQLWAHYTILHPAILVWAGSLSFFFFFIKVG